MNEQLHGCEQADYLPRGATAPATAPAQWDTTALQRDFSVIGFAAPYVVVTRKSDNVKGTLQFTHSPRVYFDFEASE